MGALDDAAIDWEAPPSDRIEIDVVVPISAEDLFDLLLDADAWPEWFPTMRSSRYRSPGPVTPGARRDVRTWGLAVAERFDVVQRPGHQRFVVTEMTPPLCRRFVEDYRIEAVEGGSRLRWVVHYEAAGWIRPVQALVRPIFARMFQRAGQRLPAFAAAWVARRENSSGRP